MLDKILEVFTKEYKEEIEYRKFMKQHIQSVNISEENFSDPRLTEPSDGKIYDYRGINNHHLKIL
jgi:hypothetical protein